MVAYDRNVTTNSLLRRAGVEVVMFVCVTASVHRRMHMHTRVSTGTP